MFRVLSIVTAIAVAIVVGYPLIGMVVQLFTAGGSFQFTAFAQAWNEPGIAAVMLDTVFVLLASGTLALLIATSFAWFMERTNARLGWAANILPLLPLMVPSLAGTVGWVALLSPKAGMVNVLLRDVLGGLGLNMAEGPLDIYSWWGVIFLYALYLVPFAYIVISAAFRNIDPSLEEAARVNGASLFRTFFTVSLPAIKPAIASAVVMVLIIGFAMFTVPATVGSGAGVEPLSVRIYRLLTFSYPARTEVAVVLSLVMLVVVSFAWWYQRRVTMRGRHSTIGGRSSGSTILKLGKGRLIAARSAIMAFVACTTVLPVIGLVLLSLQPFWTANVKLANLSLANYQEVFTGFDTRLALQNSVVLGLTGAAIVMLAATVLAMFISRSKGPTVRAVEGITRLPATLPHLVIAVAFIAAVAGPPFSLHGTGAILVLAYCVMYLPQAMLSAGSAHAQIGGDMEEASRVCGATEGRTFRQILLPLMWPGFVSGFVLCFVLMAGEVTGSVILSGVNAPVVGFTMMSFWHDGKFGLLAALSIVVSFVFTVVCLLALRFGRGRVQVRG